MNALEQYTTGPPSWLTLMDDEQMELPRWLLVELENLKKDLRQALLGEYENLEAALENMLPKVWGLRMKALPFIAQVDPSEAVKKIELEFSLLLERFPDLAGAANKLMFGLHLMTEFVGKIIEDNPNLLKDLPHQLSGQDLLSWQEVTAQFSTKDNSRAMADNLFHGSLMMELLLFAVDLAAGEDISLDQGICYELDYQSAVAVKTYAAAFGLGADQMPWYQQPKNELEQLLLEGPVLAEPEIEYILEKRRHLNTWK